MRRAASTTVYERIYRRWRAAIALAASWIVCAAPPAQAQLRPDTPRVKEAVKKALTFLEQQSDGRPGAKALMGLTFVKAGRDESDPKVAEALKSVQAQAKRGADKISMDIYSTGISIMFLVALNPSRYRTEIEELAGSLHIRQKPVGAWGYPRTHPTHGATGDTSMTQYAVLGLWEAEDQAGVVTPARVWDQVARWLLKTQDPSGGFGYQGQPSYEIAERVKQSGVRHSLTVAALGSLYIVKDRVGYRRLKQKYNDGLPEAFVLVEEEAKAEEQPSISLRSFGKVIGAGNRWVEENYDVNNLKTWIHYSLYALERYESLREADAEAANIPIPRSERRKWYIRGARYLLKTQEEDGHWESNGGPVPDTCFGALFLMGSTRKTLERSSATVYRGGEWRGGREIPPTDKVRVRDGRLVVAPLQAPLERVLQILLGQEQARRAAAIEALADAAQHGDRELLRGNRAALEKLTADPDEEIARLAVRALGRADDLNAVPLLIDLVESGPADLAWEASQALRDISRTGETFGVTAESPAEIREQAAQQWRTWYRAVRPTDRGTPREP